MKNVMLIGLLSVFFLSTASAQKCKPSHTEYDDFTEQTKEYYGNVIANSSLMEGVTSSVSMFVLKEGNTKKLYVRYFGIMDKEEYKTAQNSWMGKVEESTNTVFLSTDDKPLKFEITETRLKTKEMLGKYEIEVVLICELSDTTYQSLCKSLAQKLRLDMGNREFDYKVTKKKAAKFKVRANCAQ